MFIYFMNIIKVKRWYGFMILTGYIIEVGENIKKVCRRFLREVMTEEEKAKIMDALLKFVMGCNK